MADNPHASILQEANALLKELFEKGCPTHTVLRTGSLPDGWSNRYLAFTERVEQVYGQDPLPREVTAVIYTVSVYTTKRFFDWQRLENQALGDTPQEINAVRWAGDRLIMGPYYPAKRATDTPLDSRES